MKLRKTEELRIILKNTWPSLRQIWIFDRALLCMSSEDIKTIVEKVWRKTEYQDEKLDCDERTLFLHSAVKEYWANNVKPADHTVAFGEVSGSMFNGWPDIHNQNIAITEGGRILMIEPQTKKTWIAHKTDDRPFWVRL